MQQREHGVTFRVTGEEMAKLHRIANAQDIEIARVMRAFIHEEYQRRFEICQLPSVSTSTVFVGHSRRRSRKVG